MDTLSLQKYIEKKKNRWAASTLKSEAFRLSSMLPALACGQPEQLWEFLQAYKPYSRVTMWTRAVDFVTFISGNPENAYKIWRDDNAQLFKNAYTPKKVDMSYEEAKEAIESIKEDPIRIRAQSILSTAQRWSESCQRVDANIIGKGGKRRADLRTLHSEQDTDSGPTYWDFYSALKRVGLCPHDLRKLALTRAAENGAQAQDLMEIAGWSSIQTASFYLQPKTKDRLKQFLK